MVSGVEDEQNEFWKEAEHMYEPPVHDPKYHEPMPTVAVETVYKKAIDTKDHPSE